MEETISLKDLEGRYFFWKDDWNWLYEGIYVKKASDDGESITVEHFLVDEECLFHNQDDCLFLEQEGYFEDIDKYEVSKEEFWVNVEHYSTEYYYMRKYNYDGTTGEENN